MDVLDDVNGRVVVHQRLTHVADSELVRPFLGLVLGTDAPIESPNVLADVIELTGCESARGKAVPERYRLSPLLCFGEKGLELLGMF